MSISSQNKHEEMMIESLDDSEAYDVSGGNCVPGNIVITIKSNLPELTFDSNVEDIEQPKYDEQKQEYVFCHSNESFYLNISATGYISKEILIDGAKPKYGYKIISALPKGKVLIKTNPKNAYIDFGLSGIAPQLSRDTPFELNVGKYKTTISKEGYNSVNQDIEILSDGIVNEISINLRPKFSKIQLDISTSDNSRFVVLPIINIDKAYVNLSDLYDVTKTRSFDGSDNLEYYKIYESGFIPLPEGRHDIIINAPGYTKYSQELYTVGGGITPLSVKMEPVSGYITVIDNKNASGAEVFINNEKVGTVPFFKLKTKIGEHKVKFAKSGYQTEKETYKVIIKEDSITDFNVSMVLYREINIVTDPQSSEIFVNNVRQGFTPAKIILREGKNELTIKKNGYQTYSQTYVIEEGMSDIPKDLSVNLRMNYPLTIKTEDIVLAVIKDKGIEIASSTVPGDVDIPLGKYKLELYKDNKLRFSGRINHNGKAKVNAPIHSWGTFSTLVADYYYQENPIESVIGSNSNNIFNLMAKGQFGRFNLFLPGLSTSLLNTTVFKVNDSFKNKALTINNSTVKITDDYVFAGSCMFLNGEFRTGGSIIKNLDINLLGSYIWHPSLTKYIGINHVSGTESFYGAELTTRISTFNVNIKFGKEIIKGDFNYLVPQSTSSSSTTQNNNYVKVPTGLDSYVISVGFTLGRKVSQSNNMLRLWKKPIIAGY